MRQENPGLPLNKKTQNMCEMHKNRQNSVDSKSNICLHVGMDAREMKKRIMAEVFFQLEADANSRGPESNILIQLILDKNLDDITKAEFNRFRQVISKISKSANSKI